MDEETLWKTRAKQQWIKEGDGNTKFFHAIANGRRRANAIHEVVDNGRSITRELDKRLYFYNKFAEILGAGGSSPSLVGD